MKWEYILKSYDIRSSFDNAYGNLYQKFADLHPEMEAELNEGYSYFQNELVEVMKEAIKDSESREKVEWNGEEVINFSHSYFTPLQSIPESHTPEKILDYLLMAVVDAVSYMDVDVEHGDFNVRLEIIIKQSVPLSYVQWVWKKTLKDMRINLNTEGFSPERTATHYLTNHLIEDEYLTQKYFVQTLIFGCFNIINNTLMQNVKKSQINIGRQKLRSSKRPLPDEDGCREIYEKFKKSIDFEKTMNIYQDTLPDLPDEDYCEILRQLNIFIEDKSEVDLIDVSYGEYYRQDFKLSKGNGYIGATKDFLTTEQDGNFPTYLDISVHAGHPSLGLLHISLSENFIEPTPKWYELSTNALDDIYAEFKRIVRRYSNVV